MAEKNSHRDLTLAHRKVTFRATEASMKANHSAPASLLKVPRKKAAICHMNLEMSSESEAKTPSRLQPSKNVTVRHSAETIRSSKVAQTPIRSQGVNSNPRKKAAICHPNEKIGLEQETPTAEDNSEPKRKTPVRRSSRNIGSDRKAQSSTRLHDTSSQTDPVVVFVGDISIMAERLKQLDARNRQFVLDRNEVLVEVCDEDDLQKLMDPDLQLQQPSQQQQSSADLILLDECSSPEDGDAESGMCSLGPNKRLDENEEPGLDSCEQQGEEQNRRNGEQGLDPSENQWQDPNSESQVQYAAGSLWQEQCEKQGHDQDRGQWQDSNEKQEQDLNEKEWQDPNEMQWQHPDERQGHDQDERNLQNPQDPSCNQGHDLSVSQGQDPISRQWQDPKEKTCEGPTEKQGQDPNSGQAQSLTEKQGQEKVYTKLQVRHLIDGGPPPKTQKPDNPRSMLTVFHDCLDFGGARRGKHIRVRGGVFQRGRGGVVTPALSNAGGPSPEWPQVALHGLSDSGVLYQELSQSQCLAKKPKTSRRCVKPRPG